MLGCGFCTGADCGNMTAINTMEGEGAVIVYSVGNESLQRNCLQGHDIAPQAHVVNRPLGAGFVKYCRGTMKCLSQHS